MSDRGLRRDETGARTGRRGAVAWLIGVMLAGAMAAAGAAQAQTQSVRYLLPAPAALPAFGPWMVAQQRGYYREAGLDVSFESVQGGINVAERLAAGQGALGSGLGDTAVLVRPRGVAVRAVALLGGGSLIQLVINRGKGIGTIAELKGRSIAVLAGQDTTYFALLGILATQGLKAEDVTVRRGPPDEIVRLFISGEVEAMAAVPEWTAQAIDAGLRLAIVPPDPRFPSTAQAILASDAAIAQNPEQIRKLVHATLRGLQAIMQDPGRAAEDYVLQMPEHRRQAPAIGRVFRIYVEQVYRGQAVAGEIDEAHLQALQEAYLRDGIITARTPVGELYTNQFVK